MSNVNQFQIAVIKQAAALSALKALPRLGKHLAEPAKVGLTMAGALGVPYFLYAALNRKNGTPLLPDLILNNFSTKD